MSIIFITILILFLIKLLRDSLYFVWLWQVKEYRIDRMISHLRENKNAGSIVPLGLWSRNAKSDSQKGSTQEYGANEVLQNADAKRLHINTPPVPLKRRIATMEPAMTIAQNNLFYISAVIVFVLYLIFLKSVPLFFQYLVLIIFLFSFLQIAKEIKNRNFKRPKATLKVVLIFLLLAIVYLMIAFCWISSLFVAEETKFSIGNLVSGVALMLFIYIVNPLVISSIVLAINPLFNFQKRKIIKKATVKMERLKKIKVIGITGSYGKTSTKEFLYAILNQKYKVVRTEGNNNTNIGVAYTVLNKVNDDYDYFICEMGAYKIGEIKEICSIVNPEIGILTGINEQHLELFGSIENTIKAKFELIKSLPENGLAIINSSVFCHLREGGDPGSNGNNLLFSLDSCLRGNDNNNYFRIKDLRYFSVDNAKNIKVFQNYVEFDYQTTPTPSLLKEGSADCHSEEKRSFGFAQDRFRNSVTMHNELNNGIATLSSVARDDSNIIKFKLNLLGKHYIENVLSAIMVAEHLGMNLGEIKNAIEKIEPSKFMMRKSDGPNGSIFVDDSYSANPDGVIAALDYLNEAYSDYKKIIVFPGIMDLGKESRDIHKKLFDRIGEVCNIAYILNQGTKRLHSPIGTMEPASDCEFIFEKDFDKVTKMIKNNLDKNTVVLLESRGAEVVMIKLKRINNDQ